MKAALVRSPPSLGGLKTGAGPLLGYKQPQYTPHSPQQTFASRTSALISWIRPLFKFPPAPENVLPGGIPWALISRYAPIHVHTPNPSHTPTPGGVSGPKGMGGGQG